MKLQLIVNKEYKKSEFEKSVIAHGLKLSTVFTQELKNGYEIKDEENQKNSNTYRWTDFSA